jgi:hypothetical protein
VRKAASSREFRVDKSCGERAVWFKAVDRSLNDRKRDLRRNAENMALQLQDDAAPAKAVNPMSGLSRSPDLATDSSERPVFE